MLVVSSLNLCLVFPVLAIEAFLFYDKSKFADLISFTITKKMLHVDALLMFIVKLVGDAARLLLFVTL